MIRGLRALTAGTALLALPASGQQPPAPELAYQLVEGQNLNAFVRDGAVAAHVLLRNGNDPRILVAFPAGNSGTGLWFEHVAAPVAWTLDAAPAPVTLTDAKGRPLHGARMVASLRTPRLAIGQAVLSNVRYLRDYQAVGTFPAEVAVAPRMAADRIVFARDRLDGRPGYLLRLRVLEGHVDGRAILAGSNGRIRLEIEAATGDAPLTGIPAADLLNDRAAPDPAARQALRFLSYREKFLAGSWRFNTYFGRDTLMSVRLLMPALRPAAVEAGLGAVLARLSPAGEVAHEEGIGEFAVVQNRKSGRPGAGAELDYGMVDATYMLGPVVADYLTGPGQARARAWLDRPLASESQPGVTEPAGRLLVRNLDFVLARTGAFVTKPGVDTLIPIKPGRMTGEWRDSNEGLGRGLYAYDVNAALAPAALDAADRLFRAGLLDRYLSAQDRQAFARAGAWAAVWRDRAPQLFRVERSAAQASDAASRYAASLGVPADAAVASLGAKPLVFHALSLDGQGHAVPILNSDEGFVLLFGKPTPNDLTTYVTALMRPFPAGLMTPVGLLVANPAQASAEAQARFTPGAYHGTVVWSWQQALLAAGLERQLERNDLPPDARAVLSRAQAQLWRAIAATRPYQSSELWSWAYEGGKYKVVAFGAGKTDVDESNAAQLWSTVYLAVRSPRR